MGSATFIFSLLTTISCSFLLLSQTCGAHPMKLCKFNKIYQLGNSISDTGNLIHESPFGALSPFARLPYGRTFFKNATGRCSNGLLMIDYIDCVEKAKHSLFMVGEIRGNDYNYALFQGKTIEEVKNIVPIAVDTIKKGVRRVINLGPVRVIVLGNFPIGCFPVYLTAFQTNNSEAYDQQHCLKQLNYFSMYHKDHLKQAIEELKQEFQNATIVYGDYYNAFQWLFSHAPYLGFEAESKQKACCGIGGQYSFNLPRMCSTDPDVPVCPEPHRRIIWDGVHLTQEAYKFMAPVCPEPHRRKFMAPVCPEPHRRIIWDGVHLTQEAYKFMAGWLVRDIFPKFHCIV